MLWYYLIHTAGYELAYRPVQAPKVILYPYDISSVECYTQELLNFEHLIGVPACLEMYDRKVINFNHFAALLTNAARHA